MNEQDHIHKAHYTLAYMNYMEVILRKQIILVAHDNMDSPNSNLMSNSKI